MADQSLATGRAEKTIRVQLGKYADRLLPPINTLSASKLLLQTNIPDKLPTPLGNACRALAYQVLDMLEVACEAPEEEVEDEAAGEKMNEAAAPSAAEAFDSASPTRH